MSKTIVHFTDGTSRELVPAININTLKEQIAKCEGDYVTMSGNDYIIMLNKVTYFENL